MGQNLPPLILKARHLSGSAFCLIDIGLPEQAVGGFPLGLPGDWLWKIDLVSFHVLNFLCKKILCQRPLTTFTYTL